MELVGADSPRPLSAPSRQATRRWPRDGTTLDVKHDDRARLAQRRSRAQQTRRRARERAFWRGFHCSGMHEVSGVATSAPATMLCVRQRRWGRMRSLVPAAVGDVSADVAALAAHDATVDVAASPVRSNVGNADHTTAVENCAVDWHTLAEGQSAPRAMHKPAVRLARCASIAKPDWMVAEEDADLRLFFESGDMMAMAIASRRHRAMVLAWIRVWVEENCQDEEEENCQDDATWSHDDDGNVNIDDAESHAARLRQVLETYPAWPDFGKRWATLQISKGQHGVSAVIYAMVNDSGNYYGLKHASSSLKSDIVRLLLASDFGARLTALAGASAVPHLGDAT